MCSLEERNRMKKLTKHEFRERYGIGVQGVTEDDDIYVPEGVSTHTRLHELAHKELGHRPGRYSLEQLVDQELGAEIWSWDKLGKSINSRIGVPIISELIDRWGLGESEAKGLVKERMELRGIK